MEVIGSEAPLGDLNTHEAAGASSGERRRHALERSERSGGGGGARVGAVQLTEADETIELPRGRGEALRIVIGARVLADCVRHGAARSLQPLAVRSG